MFHNTLLNVSYENALKNLCELSMHILPSIAMPSIIEDLKDTTILVNETLNASCIFKSKPISAVKWTYNMNEELNSEIIDISSFEQTDGPYTIRTSTITWKTSDKTQRKTVSGYYTCDAINTVGVMTSHMMKLYIQCKYPSLMQVFL